MYHVENTSLKRKRRSTVSFACASGLCVPNVIRYRNFSHTLEAGVWAVAVLLQMRDTIR